MTTAHIRYLAFFFVIALLTGCAKSDGGIAPVQGRVTLDGQPLQYAVVTFQPDGKPPASSGTNQDGRYELIYKRGVMGAPVGNNRVTIVLDVQQAHRPQLKPQTDLTREVKPGPNEFNFDLKSTEK